MITDIYAQEEICELLKNKFGFTKIWKSSRETDTIDLDQFTHMLRIHFIHYLFYSPTHKAFSIGVRHENPKGLAGGGIKEWTIVMIPKIIYSIEDATKLLKGLL